MQQSASQDSTSSFLSTIFGESLYNALNIDGRSLQSRDYIEEKLNDFLSSFMSKLRSWVSTGREVVPTNTVQTMFINNCNLVVNNALTTRGGDYSEVTLKKISTEELLPNIFSNLLMFLV